LLSISVSGSSELLGLGGVAMVASFQRQEYSSHSLWVKKLVVQIHQSIEKIVYNTGGEFLRQKKSLYKQKAPWGDKTNKKIPLHF